MSCNPIGDTLRCRRENETLTVIDVTEEKCDPSWDHIFIFMKVQLVEMSQCLVTKNQRRER